MNTSLIRDLALVRDTEPGLVAKVLSAPWRDWAQAWGLPCSADAALVAVPAKEAAEANPATWTWQPFSLATPGLPAWVQVPAAWRAQLAAQLVGRSPSSPLPDEDFALAAADQALADLLKRWHRALPPSPGATSSEPADIAPTPAQALLPHAGALLLTEPGSGLRCLVGRSAYQALLPKPAAPTTASPSAGLLRTLAQHRLPLTLGLGEVEIPMADLLNLQTGDVIQFPTRLSDELPLTVAADVVAAPALRCQLGQLDGHLAIKVVNKAKAA